MMSDFVTQLLLGALTGVVAFVLGMLASGVVWLIQRRSKTETFELRSQSGAFLDTIRVPKNPTAEELNVALEKLRRAGEKAQRLQHA